jgi:two-component system phosphate regulon response regulator PhoB
MATESPPDLIILDLTLPDTDGNEICRALKRSDATRDVPVMIVSVNNAEIDRVVAFELGVDDFVAKPFSLRELVLRIRAVLRRYEQSKQSDGQISYGPVQLDRLSHRVWVDGRQVELSLLEFKILQALCEQGRRVRSREELLEIIWGSEAAISARSVDAYVKRLRKKLGPARHCIETVRGVGYRLTPVRNGI